MSNHSHTGGRPQGTDRDPQRIGAAVASAQHPVVQSDGCHPAPSAALVQDAMLRHPKTLPHTATLADVRAMLADDHVHAALLVEGRRLVGVISVSDLPEGLVDSVSALPFATLTGCTARPDDELEPLRRTLLAQGARRRAVIDQAGDLLGLLCLKRHGHGFCSEADVLQRCRAAKRRTDSQRSGPGAPDAVAGVPSLPPKPTRAG